MERERKRDREREEGREGGAGQSVKPGKETAVNNVKKHKHQGNREQNVSCFNNCFMGKLQLCR